METLIILAKSQLKYYSTGLNHNQFYSVKIAQLVMRRVVC